MLDVYNKQRQKVAILQNALSIREEQNINAVSYLYFSLPYDDPKNEYCQPFNYVRLNDGDYYRIMPTTLTRNDAGYYTYRCEHAIATLIDNVLFGYHVVGNTGFYTNQVINYVLGKQLAKNWTLGTCDFARQFEYGWEQESLLSALFSIPNCFNELYQWQYDFSTYPWKLSLKRINAGANPSLYIRNKKNLMALEAESDTTNICTRLYPLGYGEGVNQLGIADVNNGVPYLQSPKAYTDKYGIVERVWIDRRYEDAQSLKSAAQAMLAELQEPTVQYTVTFAEVGLQGFESVALGNVVRVIDTETGTDFITYIVGVEKKYDDIPSSTITIANRATDIASSVADIADRQRIEMAYSQGATNLYAQSLQGNADSKSGLKINFYIPAEMRIVNKIQAKIQVESFRAYSKAASGGGSYSGTTDSGGGYYGTSESGGGYYGSTESGGGTYTSTDIDDYISGRGGHNHGVDPGLPIAIWGGVSEDGYVINDGYRVWVKSGNHTHDVIMPSHRHEVEINNHTHWIEVPSHRHDIELPDHTHEITPGIYTFGNPSSFGVYVNGKLKTTVRNVYTDIDLTNYLVENGTIPRGVWHEVEIRPNDLSYISIDMFVQGFIQSRGDNTV